MLMPPTLPTHKTVIGIRELVLGDGPPTSFVRGDAKADVRDKFNYNFSYLEDFLDVLGTDVQDLSAAVFGRSILSGLVPTLGTGLNIDFTSGEALVGVVLALTADTIPVLANSNPGYVYLKQDGTWEVNDTGVPPVMTNFEYCRYISDATDVLSISQASRDPYKVLPAKLRTVTGYSLAYPDLGVPTVHTITHAYPLRIPGFKSVTALDPDFTVEVYNASADTETSFQVLVTYVGSYYYYSGEQYAYYDAPGYYYGLLAPVWLQYSRTGLGYED